MHGIAKETLSEGLDEVEKAMIDAAIQASLADFPVANPSATTPPPKVPPGTDAQAQGKAPGTDALTDGATIRQPSNEHAHPAPHVSNHLRSIAGKLGELQTVLMHIHRFLIKTEPNFEEDTYEEMHGIAEETSSEGLDEVEKAMIDATIQASLVDFPVANPSATTPPPKVPPGTDAQA
uniref:Gag-pol polyprotein n=1 Tax=Solanum tuberosum TaxID=4113 RepID=M1DVZ0_SOLTU